MSLSLCVLLLRLLLLLLLLLACVCACVLAYWQAVRRNEREPRVRTTHLSATGRAQQGQR